MTTDPDDEIRDDLLMHMARSIVANGVGTRERVFQYLSGIATFLIPAYPALLKLLGFSLTRDGFWPFVLPIVLWLITIVICSFWSLPILQAYDLKNPGGIVSTFTKSLAEITWWSRAAGGAMLLGVLASAYFIMSA